MKLNNTVIGVFFLFNLYTNAQIKDAPQIFTNDGAWCWFSDPRAVSINNTIYSGWVSSNGNIMVASFNKKTDVITEKRILYKFDKDDHANPSFLVLPDKRIMIFFTAHNTRGHKLKKSAIFYSTTINPEDISKWNKLQKITKNTKGKMGFCYTNPVMLSQENNRIYLFWRGANWKPTFSYSDNLGGNWSKPKTFIKSKRKKEKRPYMKVYSNNSNEIHFAFTDGHPNNEPLNSLYYVKYKNGAFYKANGTEIGKLKSLPIKHEKCDIIFQGDNLTRSWVWDLGADKKGNPSILYTRFLKKTKHEYYYAKWYENSWLNSKITDAGTTFTKNSKKWKSEIYYSGGICLDKKNLNTVYYSKPVNGIFEIFKSSINPINNRWEEFPISTKSSKNNIRPINIQIKNQNYLLWMYNSKYLHYKDFHTYIKIKKI